MFMTLNTHKGVLFINNILRNFFFVFYNNTIFEKLQETALDGLSIVSLPIA